VSKMEGGQYWVPWNTQKKSLLISHLLRKKQCSGKFMSSEIYGIIISNQLGTRKKFSTRREWLNKCGHTVWQNII
jgi:hypothetical protein